MIDHETAVVLIPEQVQGRLDPLQARHLAAHVDGCRECGELERTYRLLVSACAARSQHPEDERLVTYAIDRDRLGDDARETLAHHLASCDECAAVITAVAAAERELGRSNVVPIGAVTAISPQRSSPRHHWKAVAAAAALLAVGALGGWLASAHRTIGSSAAGWSGVSSLVLVGEQQRGDDELPQLDLVAEQSVVPLALPLTLSPDAPRDARYRVALENSQGVRVWELEISGAELAARLGSSGVLALVVPRDRLEVGIHRLVVSRLEGRRVIFQGRFRVAEPSSLE